MDKYKFVSASGFREIERLVNEFADDGYRVVQVGHEQVGCEDAQVWWAVMEKPPTVTLSGSTWWSEREGTQRIHLCCGTEDG